MYVALAEDCRQRAADVVALTLLARFSLHGVEPDLSRLGELVATAITHIHPEELRDYSSMSWDDTVREIKRACVNYEQADPTGGAGPSANRAARRRNKRSRPPPLAAPAVEERIGSSIVAALYRFVSLRAANPDWYAPHLETVP